MKFKRMSAAEYRGLDLEQLEKRRDDIVAELDDPESEVPTEELRSESEVCAAEFARRNAVAQTRSLAVAGIVGGDANPIEKRAFAAQTAQASDDAEDASCTLEYRKAFREYVRSGRVSKVLSDYKETRSDANTLTSDVGAVIPTVLVNRILEKAESYGMILPLVTKTSYKAGVEIPKGSIKPEATWVSEGASSDRQKFGLNDKVTFTHHKLRCEVSVSAEVDAMSLSAFESMIVEKVARAITVAKEKAIFNGTGSGQPKGILTETVPEGQKIELANGSAIDYQTLVACEAALPAEYENGAKWFMAKKTFYQFVSMVDDAGQPVARVNFGIGGRPERTLLGREVVFTGDYLPAFDSAPESATVYALIFDMADYVINSIYDMGIQKKQDWDTEDMLTKAVTSCDGKAIDVNSLVTLGVAAAG